MVQDFVHLHVHSQYSLLDGQASINKLVDKAIANGMKGMAITDHGNMFGIKEFLNYVNKKNSGPNGRIFKPIIGCEMYVAKRTRDKREGKQDQGGYHLIVLAKNETGYHNLIKLVSRAWTDGYYMRPRTDRSELEKYHEGLMVCTACLAGEVPRHIRAENYGAAEETIAWYKNLFGDDYYLELQRHKATVPNANHEAYPIQQKVNEKLLEYAQKFQVKVVCTNDVHFVDEENAEAHDRLICLSTGKDLDDPTRMMYTKQEWFKTKEEMNEIFADIPEALTNTMELLDKTEFYSIDHAPIMPFFPIPESFGTEQEYRNRLTEKELYDEFTRDENGNEIMSAEKAEEKIKKLGGYNQLYRIKFEADYLKSLTMIGSKRLYGDPLPDEVAERINFELHIMKTMGFPGYFLIVQDFINAARNELGVMVGPGRGSAAGSVVAYCLGITKIDPIKYDLLFERFLNPDRISLPDIDTDFDDDGRGEVLRWVTDKYGKEKVAHIITYSTMATKMAIKDVARVEKLPLSESDRLCKLVPNSIPDKKLNLQNAIDFVPELKAAETSSNPLERETLKYAKMLEGNVRGTGIHACGTIICRDDITDWVPVSTAEDKETGEKLICTQYEGSVIEDTGLIKMDFLGLKTLSILKEAVENIRLHDGIDIDLDTIPLDDPLTYQLYCEGRTVGTFQFESAGMQKYLRELHPTVFEDLIAMNALYRPGPMDYIPQFIARKNGREPIVYDIPCMEKYLKDTYGITVYQEQVMLLSRQLAGFTRGESDTLRKAMGKKQKDKLDHLRPKFMKGGQEKGHPLEVLEKIWGDWEKFASYAFNKSHATCYSWVAYQTAFLKANYPAEYMAAVMSRSLSNITDITKLMDECKTMKIQVLGPDVNESNLKFTVTKSGNIRFGLGAVKGVGSSAVESIMKVREEKPFASIFDFVQRVNLLACNKKNLECLAQSGAFDGFGLQREQYFALNAKGETFIESLIRYGNLYQTEKSASVNSLFGMFEDESVAISTPEIPVAETWGDLDRLNKERELVGIYLSAHPLDEYSVILNEVCNTQMTELDDIEALVSKGDLTMGGMVTGVRKGFTKKAGNPFGIVKIEDYSGAHEIAFFGNDWATYQGFLNEHTIVFLRAKVQPKQWKNDELELKINSVQLLSDVKDKLIDRLVIQMPLSLIDNDLITELSDITQRSPGNTELYFKITEDGGVTSLDLVSVPFHIAVGKEMVAFLENRPELTYRIDLRQ